jgi:hypothetical protein
LKNTDWPCLRILILSYSVLMQTQIKLVIKDAIIWVRRHGPCLNKFIWVIILRYRGKSNRVKRMWEFNASWVAQIKHFSVINESYWKWRSQVFNWSQLAAISVNWLKYDLIVLGANPIGNEGCHQLCKGRWPLLERLGLRCFSII